MMRQFYGAEQIAFDAATVERVFDELTASDAYGWIYLICAEAKTAGYMILTHGYSAEFGGRFLLLDELFLQEEYRGLGWGWSALDFATGIAKKLGVRYLRLEVSRKNNKALALYRNAGFESFDRDFLAKKISDETASL